MELTDVVTPPSGPRTAVDESTPSAPRSTVAWYVYWGLGLSLILPVWVGSHLPTEDGPVHLYWVDVYRSLGSPGGPWEQFYERNISWNMPYLSYFAMHYALSALLEPHVAQKVAVTLILLAWITATHFLAVTVGGRLGLGALAALLLLNNYFVYVGYFSFLTGIPVLLASMAVLYRITTGWETSASRRPAYLLLAVLGVLAYYSHLVIGALFLTAVLLAGIVYWRRLPAHAALLALTALPTLALIASYMLRDSLGGGGMHWRAAQTSAKLFFGLAFWRGFAASGTPFVLSWACAALLLGSLCVGAARSFVKGEVPEQQRLLMLVAAAFGVLFFLAPGGIGQAGGELNERIQIAMWAVLLPIVPARMSGLPRALALTGVALLAVWQLADFSLRARRFNAAYDTVLERAVAIPPGSVVRWVHKYEESRFDGSYAHVLGEIQADVAYHCRCILIQAHAPSTPAYWVRSRNGVSAAVDFDLDLRKGDDPGAASREPPVGGAPPRQRPALSLVVRTSGDRANVSKYAVEPAAPHSQGTPAGRP